MDIGRFFSKNVNVKPIEYSCWSLNRRLTKGTNAIGETLILQFGDYRRLYRNCETFADIFVQIVCDADFKAFSWPSIRNFIANSLLAFPLTAIGGSIMHTKQKIFVMKVIKKAISWEDLVDSEINDEINKIRLDVVGSKSGCCLVWLKSVWLSSYPNHAAAAAL